MKLKYRLFIVLQILASVSWAAEDPLHAHLPKGTWRDHCELSTATLENGKLTAQCSWRSKAPASKRFEGYTKNTCLDFVDGELKEIHSDEPGICRPRYAYPWPPGTWFNSRATLNFDQNMEGSFPDIYSGQHDFFDGPWFEALILNNRGMPVRSRVLADINSKIINVDGTLKVIPHGPWINSCSQEDVKIEGSSFETTCMVDFNRLETLSVEKIDPNSVVEIFNNNLVEIKWHRLEAKIKQLEKEHNLRNSFQGDEGDNCVYGCQLERLKEELKRMKDEGPLSTREVSTEYTKEDALCYRACRL